ncbi:MAG: hypothetical protein HZB57_09710 [Gammaproteobacteria bacterium]|nr:hypothetical protein [Gammaproteobacteria bacterium]
MTNFRIICSIASSFVIVVGLTACGQNTPPAPEESKKPTRDELVTEINNACYLYANSASSSSQTDAIDGFVKFAQLDESAESIVSGLQLSETFMKLDSSMSNLSGGNSKVNSKNIEAKCISVLRKKAL